MHKISNNSPKVLYQYTFIQNRVIRSPSILSNINSIPEHYKHIFNPHKLLYEYKNITIHSRKHKTILLQYTLKYYQNKLQNIYPREDSLPDFQILSPQTPH